MDALYRRLLGDDLDRLPRGLRRFHLATEGGRAKGSMRVTRGRGIVHRILGALAGFPPEGDEIPTELAVKIEGDRELWVRRFGDRPLESLQWQEGSLCAERSGFSTFVFRLEPSERGLAYRFVRARVLGIPVPAFASPTANVELVSEDDPESWRVDVRFRLPLLGEVLRYQGVIRAA